ncbi:MAG: hypothetical protein RR676_14170 [Acinetobacter sp.]
MDKMKLAHEFMMKKMETETIDNHWELFYSSWRYADAMQAEAEKRKPSGLPEALKDDPFKGLYPLIDWNKYGKGLYFWAMDENGRAFWHNRKPKINGGKWDSYHKHRASSFNYKGNWRESLRERQHGL